MGGHGGLNILPQKRWNVYNYDNREKVRQDEEAAAKEEQLKQEQSRKRDAEFRLERLRRAKGLPDHKHAEPHSPSLPDESGSNHINLFEGLKDFQFGAQNDVQCSEVQKEGSHSQKRRKTEEKVKVILPEDEKYRLGYGLVGRGVQEPWYLSRALNGTDDKAGASSAVSDSQRNGTTQKSGKKSLEELREERLKREKQEKERERMLLMKNDKDASAAKPRNYSSGRGRNFKY